MRARRYTASGVPARCSDGRAGLVPLAWGVFVAAVIAFFFGAFLMRPSATQAEKGSRTPEKADD
jgi:hypothetical protein